MGRGIVTWPFVALLLIQAAASAQEVENRFQLAGTIDITSSLAGDASRFTTNELPPNYRDPHILLHEFNLSLFVPFDDEFSLEARMRIDARNDGYPGQPTLPIYAVNWFPVDFRGSFSLGRFPTPFGVHPERQLQRDRTFIAQPLAWGYFVPLSENHGYRPGITNSRDGYRTRDLGTTPLGFEALSTGLRYDWWNRYGKRFAFAVTNTAPSSPDGMIDQLSVAVAGHYSNQPEEWLRYGVSGAYGSFMEQDLTINPVLRDTEQYYQFALGADWRIQHGRITLAGELVGSRWFLPRFQGTGFFSADGDPANPTPVKPTLLGGYTDLRIDLPTLTPIYLAGRFDTLQFLKMDDPVFGEKVDWMLDVIRWSVAFGLDLSHGLSTNLNVSDQFLRDDPAPGDDWTVRLMLTAEF